MASSTRAPPEMSLSITVVDWLQNVRDPSSSSSVTSSSSKMPRKKGDGDGDLPMPDIKSVTVETPTSGEIRDSGTCGASFGSYKLPKTTSLLALVEYPISVTPFEDLDSLPADVQTLHKDLFRLSKWNLPMIPQSLEVRNFPN
jgi:hypothetical protein